MGVDLLDLQWRIEREFEIKLAMDSFERAVMDSGQHDFTVGVFYEFIGKTIESTGRAIPRDAWERFQFLVCETLDADRDSVVPEAWLVRDLGMA